MVFHNTEAFLINPTDPNPRALFGRREWLG